MYVLLIIIHNKNHFGTCAELEILKNWYGVGIEKIINIIVSSSEHFVLNFVFTTTCTLLHTAHFVTSESENTLDICP